MGETKKTASAGHKALYRKYRSKNLSEIVGQEHITKTLENALKQSRLSHAYLFTGPRGTGKTSIARILAHEINELPYEDEATHLDIIEIDAASNRRIDDIRDLRDKVHIAPVSAKYKVYIIDEVHMLTTESFNALLKTLEEPPNHVVFILATTEVHKLPATIISRTQRHSFRLVPTSKVAEHLRFIADKEKLDIDDEALQLLAEHGEGSFRDSISLLDQMSGTKDKITAETVSDLLGLAPKDSLSKLIEATKTGDSAGILSELELLLESGLTASGLATQLLSTLREEAKSGENSDVIIALMGELLSVHASQYPQLKLETVLLSVAPSKTVVPKNRDAITLASTSSPLPEVKPVAPKKKPLQENKSEPITPDPELKKTEKEVVVPIKSSVSSGSFTSGEIDTHWVNVLEITKKKNNPLYTVLRLATPVIENEELLLIFSFPFHQKKIEESRYKALISEILEEVTGTSVTFRSIVDKSRTKTASTSSTPTADPAHASLISSVQDIMGGGEIVNV